MEKKIKKWIDKNITVNLKDKNVFITGSNSGIGFEILKHTAYLGANLYMLARNKEKAQKAVLTLQELYPNVKITFIELDLASLNSVKKCVDKIVGEKLDVDVFINNAGVYRLNGKTKDGFEITLGTNFLGTLYLNDLLNKYFLTLPHKVINVFTSSLSSRFTKIDYSDFFNEKINNQVKLYARTKIAINNLYYTYLKEYENSNIIFNIVHPGITYTPLIVKAYKNRFFSFLASVFMKMLFHTPSVAALTSLKAIQNGNNSIVGPRGIFEISGFPKNTNFKRDKRCLEYVGVGRKIIEGVVNK